MYHSLVNTGKKASIGKLLRAVKAHYQKSGRAHLPWRLTRDPYRILVSEIMLQQTQVERVIPFYNAWVKKFPTAKSLARAKLSEVLKMWSGLGYNRRAKFLHEAAKAIVEAGFPKTPEGIERLPGVGHYTARAVATFAYNKPEVFVETNIRTIFLYFCFVKKRAGVGQIPDSQILPLITAALRESRMQPREFYSALMDYGAFLKRSGVRLNAHSAQYTRQSKFEGSVRQLRGAILRELLQRPTTLTQLKQKLPSRVAKGELERQLAALLREGMIVRRTHYYQVA